MDGLKRVRGKSGLVGRGFDQAGDDANACPTGKPQPQEEREQGARTEGVEPGHPDEKGLAVIVAVVMWWQGVGRGGRGTVTRLPAHRPLIVRHRLRSLCLRRRAQCAECCEEHRPPPAGWSIRGRRGGDGKGGCPGIQEFCVGDSRAQASSRSSSASPGSLGIAIQY